MKTYQIYAHPIIGLEAVKQGWSWPGFFFGWIWAFVKGLSAYGAGMLFGLIFAFITSENLGNLLGFIFAIWMGAEGNNIRIRRLSRLGYQHILTLQAESPEAALAKLLADPSFAQDGTQQQYSASCSHDEQFGNFCTNCGADLREEVYDFIGKRRRPPITDCSHKGESGIFCCNCGRRLRESREEHQQRQSKHFVPADSDAKRYGAILGLVGKVTVQDIKKAYKELVAKYHPDKVQHLGREFQEIAEKKTKEINEAYEYFRSKYKF